MISDPGRRPVRPDATCGWVVADEVPCAAPADTRLVVLGAVAGDAVAVELTLCPGHAAEVRQLSNVVAGPDATLVMSWA